MANKAHSRGGQHKPKSIPNSHHKHYWPYIPVLLLVIVTFAVNLLQPLVERAVLSYATEMSVSQLLAATNAQRAANGVAPLTLNSKLNSAAQSKAEDMVTRNYWSHNTPDGQEPWVFFNNVGYKYFKAGENLAYGFSTSDATVAGWMNSPTHKANLLDGAFTEVGFGFTNGEDFNNSGPETVVVAEYGRPQVLAQANTAQSATTPAQPASKPTQVAQATPTTTPAETIKDTVVNTDNKSTEPKSIAVSRIESISGGKTWLVFATGLITGIAIAAILIKHALALRHFLRSAEHLVLRHPVADAVLVGIVLIGSFLLQTNGVIR